MLDERHLQHQLTDEQRSAINEDGYFIVENALPSDLVERLETRVDNIYQAHLDAGYDPYAKNRLTEHNNFFYPNFLGTDQVFVNILDWYKTFPKVWGILGWNIYSYHSHFIITPPRPEEVRGKPTPLGWHQDSGRVNIEMESSPRPRLSIKVVYWLSDCSEPGRGNFYIIPGSHLWDKLEDRPTDGSLPEGAIAVCCKPGDAVFFDRRLWHSRSENDSDITRKGLFYGYGYRWLRSKDNMTIPEEMFERNDPIRQQLLGGGTNANGHFSPKDADVPLKVWLEEKGILSSWRDRHLKERKSGTLNTAFLDTPRKLAYNLRNNIFRRSCMSKSRTKNSWRHTVMFLTRLNVSIWAATLMTALIISTASGEEAVTTPDMLKVGMIAPDFTLKDEDGVERNLSDYLGQKSVVLAFYPKDFTGGWTAELNSLRDSLSEIEATDSVLFGVSVDSVESHKRFRTEQKFGFSLLADTEFKVSTQYSGIIERFNASQRTTFIIDKAGYIRAIDRDVNVKTHGEDVVAQLKEVLPKIAAGQTAPDFIATDGNGETHQLREFRGKKNVVLAFYPRDFGTGWTAEVCSLRDESSNFAKYDAQVFGITTNDADSHQKFSEENQLNFPLLVDTGRNLSLLYGATNVLEGRIGRLTVIIDKEGKISEIDKAVNPSTHGSDLVNFFKTLETSK